MVNLLIGKEAGEWSANSAAVYREFDPTLDGRAREELLSNGDKSC